LRHGHILLINKDAARFTRLDGFTVSNLLRTMQGHLSEALPTRARRKRVQRQSCATSKNPIELIPQPRLDVFLGPVPFRLSRLQLRNQAGFRAIEFLSLWGLSLFDFRDDLLRFRYDLLHLLNPVSRSNPLRLFTS
jgi:hypothetical protein